jgi:hypothetical protein
MDHVEPLRALEFALASGHSTFAWALAHARDGDPLPELWQRCDDPIVMLCIAARVSNERCALALLDAAADARTYPHARDCLTNAARYLRDGAISSAESWTTSAFVHYPGRGTARPQPEKGRAVSDAICGAIRSRISLSMEVLG